MIMFTPNDIRQQYGLSQQQLADKLGVSIDTIIEREQREPTIEEDLALQGLERILFMDRVVEADRQRQLKKQLEEG